MQAALQPTITADQPAGRSLPLKETFLGLNHSKIHFQVRSYLHLKENQTNGFSYCGYDLTCCSVNTFQFHYLEFCRAKLDTIFSICKIVFQIVHD